MIWDEFLRHFRFCDEEDSGLSDEEQERKEPKNRPKHTRKRIHQAKKNFLEKFKTVSYPSLFFCRVNTNSSPPLGLFLAKMVPPWKRTAFLTMASPSPVPPNLRERPLSTR